MPGPFKFQINLPRVYPPEERAKLLHGTGHYQPVPTGSERHPTTDRVPVLGCCFCVLLVLLATAGVGFAAMHHHSASSSSSSSSQPTRVTRASAVAKLARTRASMRKPPPPPRPPPPLFMDPGSPNRPSPPSPPLFMEPDPPSPSPPLPLREPGLLTIPAAAARAAAVARNTKRHERNHTR